MVSLKVIYPTSSCIKENCLVNIWEIKKNLLVHHLWNGDPSSWFMLNLTSFWKRNFNIILPPPLLTLLITGPWVWLTSPLARLAFEPSWPCLWNGWLALGPEWLALRPGKPSLGPGWLAIGPALGPDWLALRPNWLALRLGWLALRLAGWPMGLDEWSYLPEGLLP